MTQGTRPDGVIFASQAGAGELEAFPAESRGWGVTVDGNDGGGSSVTEPTDGIPPMEWMNGILNKLSSQIFWNMRHAIPSWLAGSWDAGAFVAYSGWVYYNSSTSETSETPGDGEAWVKIFPLGEMDGRYLQIAKNLSEIASQGATAQGEGRANLGCGTAATHNVQEFIDDIENGKVLMALSFNIGAQGISEFTTDFSSNLFLSGYNVTFDMAHCTNIPAGLPTSGVMGFSVISMREGSNNEGALIASVLNDPAQQFLAVFSGERGVSRTWSVTELYSTKNPQPIPEVDLSPYIKTTDANAKFLQGVQFGAVVNVNGDSYTAPAGHALVGITAHNGNYDTQIDSFHAKPIQENVNGTWKTIAG